MNSKELIESIPEKTITLFQRDFLMKVQWFVENRGEFVLIPHYIEKYYNKIGTPEELQAEVKDLVERYFLFKKYVKYIFNGEYRTKITFTVNLVGIEKFIKALSTPEIPYEKQLEDAISSENYELAAKLKQEYETRNK